MNTNETTPIAQILEAVKRHSGLTECEIIQASEYGADQGFTGFIYNPEAARFFDETAELIWEHLCQSADDLGLESPIHLIATFGRIDMADCFQGLKVLLAWYALEEAGRYLTGHFTDSFYRCPKCKHECKDLRTCICEEKCPNYIIERFSRIHFKKGA